MNVKKIFKDNMNSMFGNKRTPSIELNTISEKSNEDDKLSTVNEYDEFN